MNRRDLVNFMDTANTQKNVNFGEINPKDTTVYNIRKTDNGLYFNIKIPGDFNTTKDIKDLFIPVRFYQKVVEPSTRQNIIINKAKLVEYFLLYPGAIISLGIIFAAIFKYLPVLERFFNFTL